MTFQCALCLSYHAPIEGHLFDRLHLPCVIARRGALCCTASDWCHFGLVLAAEQCGARCAGVLHPGRDPVCGPGARPAAQPQDQRPGGLAHPGLPLPPP